MLVERRLTHLSLSVPSGRDWDAHRLESVKPRPLGGGAWLQVPDISNYIRRELGYLLSSYLLELPHPPLPPPNSPLPDCGHLLSCRRTAEQLLIKPANHKRGGEEEGRRLGGASAQLLYSDGIKLYLHFRGGSQGRPAYLYPHGAPPAGGGREQLTEG